MQELTGEVAGWGVTDVMTVLVLFLACAWVYLLLAIVAGLRFAAVHSPARADTQTISILKPLSGLEPGLESNLRTFFEQQYPCFELLFAVQDPDDPAAALVKRLSSEFPEVPCCLLFVGKPTCSNAKVHSLERLFGAAGNDLIVMSDSDTRVGPEFLQIVSAEFRDPALGLATCPYRAVPGKSLWSRMEATGLNTDFMAGILVARMLEGMRFAVGPTIVARRSVLLSIGGFSQLKDYLAEDFAMGKITAGAGHGVALSSYVIEHHIGDSEFKDNAAHRLRWVRSTRRSRPLGYIGQIMTMPLPFALLLTGIYPAWWPVLGITLVLRAAAADVISRRVLKARVQWALLPFEDIVAFSFWLAGFFGNTITWRGRRYRLYGDGRFEPVTATTESGSALEASSPARPAI